MNSPLLNHTSENTAYVVNDYPYGYKLRCKIRYWIEYSPKKGFRFCSQTTNPKINKEYWNKAKKGTYSLVAMIMYLDSETGHVEHRAISQYETLEQCIAFKEKYTSFLNPESEQSLDEWLKAKKIFEEKIRPHLKIITTIKHHEPVPLMSLIGENN